VPSIASDLNHAPLVVGKVQIDSTVMLGDADVNTPPGPIKLCPGLKQIEGRADRPGAGGGAGGFVMFPPQPGTKAGAANRPGFPVPIDHEICERGAVGGVKQLGADQIGEHIGLRRSLVDSTLGPRCRARLSRFRFEAGVKRAVIQARVCPQPTSNLDRFDSGLLPPRPLIADTMNGPMMDPT
jgi:hypothetical protein